MPRFQSLRFAAPLAVAGFATLATTAHAQEVAPAAPQVVAQAAPPMMAPQPYPPPGYPPPGYSTPQPYYAPAQPYFPPAQPYYGPAMPPGGAPVGEGRRIIEDWDDSHRTPPGYHVERHIRRALVIDGAITFGVTYLLTALSAAAVHDASSGGSTSMTSLYVPGIGPFLQMTQGGSATANVFLALDGAVQVAGIAMFTIGLAAPRTDLVRDDFAVRLQLSPVVSRDQTGMALLGRF
jgi:hypothetical protein